MGDALSVQSWMFAGVYEGTIFSRQMLSCCCLVAVSWTTLGFKRVNEKHNLSFITRGEQKNSSSRFTHKTNHRVRQRDSRMCYFLKKVEKDFFFLRQTQVYIVVLDFCPTSKKNKNSSVIILLNALIILLYDKLEFIQSICLHQWQYFHSQWSCQNLNR